MTQDKAPVCANRISTPRLYRPHIPVEVKCRVAMRQLRTPLIDHLIDEAKREGYLKHLFNGRTEMLAELLGCDRRDLRLDHDPPLGVRKRKGEGKKTVYDPPANDPRYLRYRPHGTQFEDSHDVKTRIRGDHGQFSDLALIKRERRRLKKLTSAKSSKLPKRDGGFKRITSRPLRSANRWPPKGGRKIRNRRKEKLPLNRAFNRRRPSARTRQSPPLQPS